jgi:hypothetical protein
MIGGQLNRLDRRIELLFLVAELLVQDLTGQARTLPFSIVGILDRQLRQR